MKKLFAFIKTRGKSGKDIAEEMRAVLESKGVLGEEGKLKMQSEENPEPMPKKPPRQFAYFISNEQAAWGREQLRLSPEEREQRRESWRHSLSQQKKRFRLDMSWKENKEALMGVIKWIVFLLILNAVRGLIFRQ
jgi:hypothetical protein